MPDEPLTLADVLAASSRPLAFSAILDASLDAFHENGYGGSTVRDIANRVGVTVPALYYHHENKEAILFALLSQSIDRLHELTGQAFELATSGRERLDSVVEILVRHTAMSGRLTFLDSEIRSLTPEHRAIYVARRAEIEDLTLRAIRQGIDEGAFPNENPRDCVRAMLGMIQAISSWYRVDGQMTVDDLVGRYLVLARRLAGGR